MTRLGRVLQLVEQEGYGITDTWDEIVDKMMEISLITLEGVNERVTEPDTTVRQRMDEFEVRFEDAQFDRALLRARVNTLFRDRPDHCRIAMLMDREAMYSYYVTTDPVDYGTCTHRGTFVYLLAIIKMAPKKRTMRATPATATTPTTTITNAQLQARINRGVVAALAERDADRSWNGDSSNDSGMGERRQMSTPRECSYIDFLKCQPMSFQGTKGVVGSALTWWNSHMGAVGQDFAYAMPWAALKRMITSKYCPRGEIKKLESEFWNLKVKGLDLLIYNHRFKELALMCDRMFPEESAKAERYIGGLPDMIHGTVKASKPQSMQEAIEFANEMIDNKMLTYVERNYKSDCLKLKNGNQGNRAGNGNDVARAYAVGTDETNLNSNVVMGTFLLNNRYASVLFDTSADRGFVSTAFSSLIGIIPTTLDHGYDVKLADSRIIWVNTLIRGCTLNFLNHPFNIDLMPVEMGSFDVIIGMDWLVKYHAIIVCDEKLVHVPFGDEILTFHGDGSINGHESRLNIISCTKTQRYLLKGCPIFLAHFTTKEAEDKSKEKRLEDVPVVQDFLEVFPEDLPEEAFQAIKQKLCSAPILALPDGSEDFVVYCDASIKGLGAVLIQRE
nr:reverse transcriptase domain-containing protein [Tanacetum cinerariifolium]